jgi:hypothetical protein
MVPPDCSNCGHRLRPESSPTLPWFEAVPKFPKVKVPSLPSWQAPSWKGPDWKAPPWFKGRGQEQASLFVDDEARYTDDPDAGESSAPVEPAEVEVVSKNKKGKNTPVPADESGW